MKQFLVLCIIGAFMALSMFPASSRVEADEDDTALPESSEPVLETPVSTDTTTKTDDNVAAREAGAIKLDGLSVEESQKLRESSEKHDFQSDVTRMMKLIINSLYKNKEIFLRELISNASDALDKIRFYSLTDKSALGDTPDLTIKIHADKENKVLHITDTGVGMTKDELVKNLGTIAKSGTSEFLNSVASGNVDTSNLIGQFGVGFYSAFLVADVVVVTSKSNNDPKQHIWTSDSSSFTVVEDPREDNQLGRGTRVSLYLKEEAQDYLETDKLRDLIKKYSEFINFDIYLYTSRSVQVEVEEEDDEDEETPEGQETNDEAKVEDEDEKKEGKTKKRMVDKTVWDWEIINANKPIWTRNSKDVTDEEYVKFYHAFSKDSKDPICHMHFTAEGEVAFRSILYVPPEAPHGFFSEYGKHTNTLKLYVRRVFITDEFDDMLPKYLSFIRGVVDSDDLPLNVSRETLQQHKLLKVIKKKLVRKALEMLKKMDDEAYMKFWKQFGTAVKLGIMEDYSNRSRISKLLRFQSSHDSENYTSLEAYVGRMKKNQPAIYFLAGQSRKEVETSPFIENLLKRGYEVLYLIEPVDEYTIQNLPEFDGKKFQNIAKNYDLFEATEKQKERKESLSKEYEPLTTWLAETLSDSVEKAQISDRLADSPCALIANQYGWDGNMERIMKAQAYAKSDDSNTEHYSTQKKIMEINPRHPLIKMLLNRVKDDPSDSTTTDLAKVLLDTARLRSGYMLHDSLTFASRIEKILRLSSGVSLDEKIEEEVFEEEEESTSTQDAEEEEVSARDEEEL